jgi:ABC-type sugar transport system ATPase subunit
MTATAFRSPEPAPDAADPLLRVSGISKQFGVVQALIDVGLELRRGEIVALVGENGSGKSTLSKVIAGVHRPDGGGIFIDGVHADMVSPRAAMELGIALVSQEPTAVPNLSIAENVMLPQLGRALRTVRQRDLVEMARPHLLRVGLDIDASRPFSSLGQGDRELAEVAKAIALDPKVLILDEATTRLPDPERLFRVVEQLCDTGVAALVITHRLREIRRMAMRAVVLRDGRLVGELERSELTDERISSMMVGRTFGEFYVKAPVEVADVVLEINGVVTDRTAVPISLTVRAGEIVGLAGLVGSGRSELLETIAGVRATKAGSVSVNGVVVGRGSPRHALAAGVALVPEDRYLQGLIRHQPIITNLALSSHRAFARSDVRQERQRAHDAVSRLGIRCSGIDAPVATLSGGNAQKVVMARCLAQQPKVLMLDEPTRGIDVGAKSEIYQVISEMVANKMAVLIASSDLMELLALCDRIVVLHEGELVGELSSDEASEENIALLSAGGTLGGVQ